MYHYSYSAFRPFNCVCLTTLINKGLTKVMKQFIISLSICLFFNMLCNESLIGHFSLFYIQVMILFVIEEVRLRIDERFSTWRTSIDDAERAELYSKLVDCPRLNYLLNDITELGFILRPDNIFAEHAQMALPYHPNLIQQFQQSWNNGKHEDIGLAWLVARGYTADKLGELEEDMPRILAYLRNVQTSKAIEAL